ncbi:MAG: hypothetical protein V2A78_12210 [bacterium]
MKKEAKDELEFLEEVLVEYEKYIHEIGQLGYAASLLLNYRDEAQESLEELQVYQREGEDLDLQPYWQRLVAADTVLRTRAEEFVNEVGYANFKQYQLVNDPPRSHWWWYLDKETAPPITTKTAWWDIGKRKK